MGTDMGTDNELLAEVRAMLHEEVADVTAGPGLLAGVRRKRTRRTVVRRLGIAVTVAAAAAIVTPLVWPSPPAETPPAVNAAHVIARTTQALDGVAGDVLYARAVMTEGDPYGQYSKPGEEAVYEQWQTDGGAFRLRITVDGQPVYELSFDINADVVVDYRTRTYISRPGTQPGPAEYDDVLTPEQIQRELADGWIKLVGPGEPINGKPTVKLLRDVKGAPPMDLWVDTTTYLPVRWEHQQEYTAPYDVTWLPPTPENLAQLKTTIPDGFTEQR